ncbi:MAG: precorrin-8X methylmutase [Nitrospinae bacterium]|nr:precorrin-8X methylmutase [Nitrospinota bacterium]
MKKLKPEEIETESFRIIKEELGEHSFNDIELPVVLRIIHTSADFEFAKLIRFNKTFFEAVHNSFKQKRDIVTDTNMILSGISKPLLDKIGIKATCYIKDEEIIKLSKETGRTRASLSMEKASSDKNVGGLIIGNAPTALREALRIIEEKKWAPDYIIGVPVGFVDAAESKDALMETNIPYFSIKGRKGGSTIAVSIVNALMRLYTSK